MIEKQNPVSAAEESGRAPNNHGGGGDGVARLSSGPLSSVDRRLKESDLSPNELDQTDESQKAGDITRAGEGLVPGAGLGPDCDGETPQAETPCAPDGRSDERYAG